MFHALAPSIDSGAMNKFATRPFRQFASLSHSLHCVLKPKSMTVQRDIIGERRGTGQYFFSSARFSVRQIILSIYSVSNFNNVFCTFYDYYFYWCMGMGDRPNETWMVHTNVFVFFDIWCALSWSERRRYNVCHTTAVPIELNFYIIISHIIFIFAVSRVLDNVILKFDANA